MIKSFAIQKTVSSADIKRFRKKYDLSQKEFANLVGVSKPTIERWEEYDSSITGPVVILLRMLEEYPEFVSRVEIPKKEYSIRLWYMYKNKPCTVIDVDDHHKKIKIKNFVCDNVFRAFGVNENPNYDDYVKFLESRCFASSRDKMKLILNDLDLPFYDPFMIIEKTEGKMAEDDFWIKVEK